MRARERQPEPERPRQQAGASVIRRRRDWGGSMSGARVAATGAGASA